MLVRLTISDILLVERLDIVLCRGLVVVTGETGAGKSMLLDSLSLTLGARGNAGLVRSGAECGQVAAVFDPPVDHPVRQLLGHDLPPDQNGFVLRRIQYDDGRTRAFINDRPVSARRLKDIGAALVEIHGQHDERALIDPAGHRALLDLFGGHQEQIGVVRDAWQAWGDARRALTERKARIDAARRDRDYLEHVLRELDELKPGIGEEEILSEQRAHMMQAEKAVGDLRAALDGIDGDGALLSRFSGALRRLERHAERAPDLVAGPLAALERVMVEVTESRDLLQQAIERCHFDPAALERAEERLFALRAVARKHDITLDELPALWVRLRDDLEALDAAEGDIAADEKRLAQAKDDYLSAAHILSRKRYEAAGALNEAVMAELAPLKLERAVFMARIETGDDFATVHGVDRVSFFVQTNPGVPAGPLHRIASGGELSRFVLALKVALADRVSAPTLIFDEIDSAVGGAVADAIGQRLELLSRTVQVLAITHAPQIAARADCHLRIAKTVLGASHGNETDMTTTRIDELDMGGRLEEIARMLSGAEITDEARAQARRLLAVAD